jgi:ABC-type nickel/cobalt efflux system permease component RcnA
MSLSSELREWRQAFVELIQDEKKKHRKAPAWPWFLVALGFPYGVMAFCGRSTHN